MYAPTFLMSHVCKLTRLSILSFTCCDNFNMSWEAVLYMERGAEAIPQAANQPPVCAVSGTLQPPKRCGYR